MIKNVDKNSSDGGIDFEEFIELMVKHGSNIDEDIAESFKVFDRDGDGLITEDELQITMDNLGEPMNEVEVKAMIDEADLDGDGKINFKEFQQLMDKKELYSVMGSIRFVILVTRYALPIQMLNRPSNSSFCF